MVVLKEIASAASMGVLLAQHAVEMKVVLLESA